MEGIRKFRVVSFVINAAASYVASCDFAGFKVQTGGRYIIRKISASVTGGNTQAGSTFYSQNKMTFKLTNFNSGNSGTDFIYVSRTDCDDLSLPLNYLPGVTPTLQVYFDWEQGAAGVPDGYYSLTEQGNITMTIFFFLELTNY